MRTKQEIEAELKASERDKTIARFCEVIADYGLPIPTDMQASQSTAEQSERRRAQSSGGVFGGK
jgi:hypothetical protein